MSPISILCYFLIAFSDVSIIGGPVLINAMGNGGNVKENKEEHPYDAEEMSENDQKRMCHYRISCYEKMGYGHLAEKQRQKRGGGGLAFSGKVAPPQGPKRTLKQIAVRDVQKKEAERKIKKRLDETDGETVLAQYLSEKERKMMCKYRKSCYQSGVVPKIEGSALLRWLGRKGKEEEEDKEEKVEEKKGKKKLEGMDDYQQKVYCRYRPSCYESGIQAATKEWKWEEMELNTGIQETFSEYWAKLKKLVKRRKKGEKKEEEKTEEERAANEWDDPQRKLECRYRRSCYESGELPEALRPVTPKEEEKIKIREGGLMEGKKVPTSVKELKLFCKYRKSCYVESADAMRAAAKEEAEGRKNETVKAAEERQREVEEEGKRKKTMGNSNEHNEEGNEEEEEEAEGEMKQDEVKEDDEEEGKAEKKPEKTKTIEEKMEEKAEGEEKEEKEPKEVEQNEKMTKRRREKRPKKKKDDGCSEKKKTDAKKDGESKSSVAEKRRKQRMMRKIPILKIEKEEGKIIYNEDEDGEETKKEEKEEETRDEEEKEEVEEKKEDEEEREKEVEKEGEKEEEESKDDEIEKKEDVKEEYETKVLPAKKVKKQKTSKKKYQPEAKAKVEKAKTWTRKWEGLTKEERLRCRYRKSCYATGNIPKKEKEESWWGTVEEWHWEVLWTLLPVGIFEEDSKETEEKGQKWSQNIEGWGRMSEKERMAKCKYRKSCYEMMEKKNAEESRKRGEDVVVKKKEGKPKKAADMTPKMVAREADKKKKDEILRREALFKSVDAETKLRCRYRKSCYEENGREMMVKKMDTVTVVERKNTVPKLTLLPEGQRCNQWRISCREAMGLPIKEKAPIGPNGKKLCRKRKMEE